MRRATIIGLLLVLAATIAVTAQGRMGKGRCGMGQNGAGAGMCAMNGGAGMGMGMGAGGWWNKVQPQTTQQKQFVDEIAGLHNRIWSEQAELNAIKLNKGNPNRAAALETDLTALRTRVYDLMTGNQPLLKQMGITAPGKGMCGMTANCPKDPAKCANCPNKDICAAQGAACPKNAPASGCPMTGAAKGQPGTGCPLANK